jgi:AcrR family transcriptional regulator
LAKQVDTLTAKARQTRQNILWAARDILGRKGMDAINVMEVCAEAGVGRTSFYNYFDDIDALVDAVAVDAASAIKAQFDALHLGEPRGLPRLEKCLRMLLTAGSEDPGTMLLLTTLAAHEGPIRDLLRYEIVQELGRPEQQEYDATSVKAEFLTSVVLALSRDIASGRATSGSIPGYVSMMMASTVTERSF